MKIRLLLAALLLATPALGQSLWPADKLLGSRNDFDSCRDGTLKGGGLDDDSGLYAFTCGNFNWHGDLDGTQTTASYYVDCTGNGRPHSSCIMSGERRLIGALHRVAVAVFKTQPGGRVLLPNFPNKDHGIYVDVGGGVLQGTSTQAELPVIDEWWIENLYPTAYAAHGPVARTFTIQTILGIEIVGENRPTYEMVAAEECPGAPTGNEIELPAICRVPKLHGSWLVNDRGTANTNTGGIATIRLDGPNGDLTPPGQIFIIGGGHFINPCNVTSNTDPTCTTLTNENEYDNHPLWIAGSRAAITKIDESASQWCIENAIGVSFDFSNGAFCSLAPMIQCTDNSGASALRSDGGCDFGVGGDFGICMGFVDGAQFLQETQGQDLIAAWEMLHCADTTNSSADCPGGAGSVVTYTSIKDWDSGIGCTGGTSPQGVKTGFFPAQSSAFDLDEYPTGVSGFVYLTTSALMQNAGGGYRKVGMMPADWLGRWSANADTAGNTTTTGAVSVMELSSITTGSSPEVDALIGLTVTIEKGENDVAYRTISDNDATTITWTAGAVTLSSGDSWEITDEACMSSMFGTGEWLKRQDETACDTETLLAVTTGIGSGSSGFVDSMGLLMSTTDGNKSTFDAGPFGKNFAYRNNTFALVNRNALADLAAGYRFEGNSVLGGYKQQLNTIIAVFDGDVVVRDNYFENPFGIVFLTALYPSNVLFEHNVIMGGGASGSPIISIQGGRRIRLLSNHIAGLDGSAGKIQIKATNFDIQGLDIIDNTFGGVLTQVGIGISDDGVGRISQVRIDGLDIRTSSGAACGVTVETGHGSDTSTFSISNVDIEGNQGGHKAVCFGEVETVTPATSIATNDATLDFLPLMHSNTNDGVLDEAWGPPMMSVASVDCDDLKSDVYYFGDGDGSCTDTGSDGTLDAGSAFQACDCDGAGTWTARAGGGVGEANTHSSLGGGLALTAGVPKFGVDLQLISLAAADFDSAADVATIDDSKWAKDSELHTVFSPAASPAADHSSFVAEVDAEIDGAGGAGLTASGGVLATKSDESGFIEDLGVGDLTCGAGTEGKFAINNADPPQWCNSDVTPIRKTLAFGDDSGLITDFSNAADLDAAGQVADDSHNHTNLTGTTSLTWIIDSDGSGTEPATGAGLHIEGGSGDVTALYNATSNMLEFAGAAGGYDFDGGVFATSFEADPSTLPALTMKDSDMGGTPDINIEVLGNCPTGTTAGGNEDCDLAFRTQVAGVLIEAFRIDTADDGTQTVVFTAPIPSPPFTGTTTFAGSTSGTAGLKAAAVAGATTATLPTATGVLAIAAAASGAIDCAADVANCTASAITASSTDTLTNKTLDTEATGNVLTVVDEEWYDFVGCPAATAALNWDTEAGLTAPAIQCIDNGDTTQGQADFDDATAEGFQRLFKLPATWTGNIDVDLYWRGVNTTLDVCWVVQTACTAVGEVWDGTFTAAGANDTVSDTAAGTTLQLSLAAFSSITTTGCAASELMHLRVKRDGAEAETQCAAGSDDFVGDALGVGLEITMRRAL